MVSIRLTKIYAQLVEPWTGSQRAKGSQRANVNTISTFPQITVDIFQLRAYNSIMKLRFNRNKRWWSKKDQSNIAAAIRYCVMRYNMQDFELVVKLGKRNTLYDGLSDTTGIGEYKIWIYPNKHELQTVFHEMTHIKQFYFYELDMDGSVPKWMGKKNGQSYSKCPWEKEANKMEKVLLKEFLDLQLNS